jgi:hypothetical protein
MESILEKENKEAVEEENNVMGAELKKIHALELEFVDEDDDEADDKKYLYSSLEHTFGKIYVIYNFLKLVILW